MPDEPARSQEEAPCPRPRPCRPSTSKAIPFRCADPDSTGTATRRTGSPTIPWPRTWATPSTCSSPTGERFFIQAVRDAKPHVTDPELRDAIDEFIKQEAWHAQAHDAVLRHLDDLGIDPSGYVDRLERFFDMALRDRPSWPSWTQRWQLMRRLAITAALEHFTAVLGHWALTTDGLDRAGADETMLDLFRWHAAEEVEHRALVYDVYQHLGGGYGLRALTMIGTTVGLLVEWSLGVRYFFAHDPSIRGRKPKLREYVRASRRGRVPGIGMLLRSVPRYLRRDHHPEPRGRQRARAAVPSAVAGTELLSAPDPQLQAL